MMWGGGRRRTGDRDKGGIGGIVFFAIWMVAILLAPLVAQLLAMMVSRQPRVSGRRVGRRADAQSARPGARAREDRSGREHRRKAIKQGSAHLCIADPLGRQMNLKEGFWPDLFASHPPMAARIAALKEMAFQRSPQ